MITALLIVYFRWLFECAPMTENGKVGVVALCLVMTFVEAFVCYTLYRKEI